MKQDNCRRVIEIRLIGRGNPQKNIFYALCLSIIISFIFFGSSKNRSHTGNKWKEWKTKQGRSLRGNLRGNRLWLIWKSLAWFLLFFLEISFFFLGFSAEGVAYLTPFLTPDSSCLGKYAKQDFKAGATDTETKKRFLGVLLGFIIIKIWLILYS